MNVIARLEYELTYYDSAVHRFNHYTTRTPPYLDGPRIFVVLSFFFVYVSMCLCVCLCGVRTPVRKSAYVRVSISACTHTHARVYVCVQSFSMFLENLKILLQLCELSYTIPLLFVPEIFHRFSVCRFVAISLSLSIYIYIYKYIYYIIIIAL